MFPKQAFLSAALILEGKEPPTPDDKKVGLTILKLLGYDTDIERELAGSQKDPETCNRLALLLAAGAFRHLFRLGCPDAPGVVFVGGILEEADETCREGTNDRVSVGGTGFSFASAFESCIGEGIEYLSTLKRDDMDLREVCTAERDARHGTDDPMPSTLWDRAWSHAEGVKLECLEGKRLAGGERVLVPADICVRLPGNAKEASLPTFTSAGTAAGRNLEEATCSALLELIERDAAALWWLGGRRGRAVPLELVQEAGLVEVIDRMRQGREDRRTWCLDITTDLGVPCVAVMSCNATGRGFACGLSARPTLTDALKAASLELCQMEVAHHFVAAKIDENGVASLSEGDRRHWRRAQDIDVNDNALLFPLGLGSAGDTFQDKTSEDGLDWLVERLAARDVEAYRVEMTHPGLAVPVVRIVAPKLQSFDENVTTDRLASAVLSTGGGGSFTAGCLLL